MAGTSDRRYLTRWEVLRWNPEWNDRDREMIAAALDAIKAEIGYDPEPYLPPSETYIGIEVWGELGNHYGDSQGPSQDGYYRALIIYKSKLEWVGHGTEYTEHLDESLFNRMREGTSSFFELSVFMQWHRLSTYDGRRSRRAGRADEPGPICPACFLVLPKSRVCDNCGEAS